MNGHDSHGTLRRGEGLSTLSQPTTATTTEDRSAYRAVTLFPLLVLLAGVIGYAVAGPVSGGAGLITPLLGLIMFGMGLTLTLRSRSYSSPPSAKLPSSRLMTSPGPAPPRRPRRRRPPR
ncbi:hypothetical protein [Serinicoccus marinus]|uniref:hypothetical protein n=1 Tax=Serinicoccus marinus TaxID=247333 RepID=UPI0003B4DEA6|nr:hypothetical protein [Serinicoccus marinus]